jgi:hypothetical protein
MYLNNSLISYGICNGIIGVVTYVDPSEEYARITFSVRGSIIDIDIYKQTHYFEINGIIAAVLNFPCRTASRLPLSRVCLALDGNIFSPGQAYVALSRYFSWDNIEIFQLDKSAFMIN